MSCGWCNRKAALLCSKCKMVNYCCREHQIKHFKVHKTQCEDCVKAEERLVKEESKLRSRTGNHFKVSHGHFWRVLETRDFMRAKSSMIKVLEIIGSRLSLNAASGHVLNCLDLCRGDNMGLRDLLPSFLLCLGRDQECYDFLKW